MSPSSNSNSKVDSDEVLSLEDYRGIVDDFSSSTENNSKVGHLYPEKNTPDFRWFKGSSDRGIRRKIVA